MKLWFFLRRFSEWNNWLCPKEDNLLTPIMKRHFFGSSPNLRDLSNTWESHSFHHDDLSTLKMDEARKKFLNSVSCGENFLLLEKPHDTTFCISLNFRISSCFTSVFCVLIHFSSNVQGVVPSRICLLNLFIDYNIVIVRDCWPLNW